MTKVSFHTQQVSWQDAKSDLMRIREQVFVREQKVPTALEHDEYDAECYHFLAYDEYGTPVGTARMLHNGYIGRMAVLPRYRSLGVGSKLLTNIIETAKAKGFKTVYLNAQTHAVAFYKKHRFQTTGSEFMEAGIAHIRMQRDL
jgi:predicted GNAT family N-acyltransferase